MMDVDDGMFFCYLHHILHSIFPLYFFMAGIRNIIFTLLSNSFTDQVIRVPRNPPSTTNPSTASGSPLEDVEEDVDVEMAAADEDLKIKPPPRKRKPKKVIPVGRNGLKKRRVEKSRTSFDEKGYMGEFFCLFALLFFLVCSLAFLALVLNPPASLLRHLFILSRMLISYRKLIASFQTVTEDYSSYESVSEGEEEQSAAEPASKSKAKAKSKTKTKSPILDEAATTNKKPTSVESPGESASKGKPAGDKSTGTGKAATSTKGKTGGSSKGDIKNFFAKK